MLGGIYLEKNDVSVIIPVFNGEKYIARCLESILNQSYKNIEIIVVDDNSNDGSIKIVNEYLSKYSNIRLIRNQTNVGAAISRNNGLSYSRSEYVLFLDCDDWIDLNCIEKAMIKFKNNAEIDIVLWEIQTAYFNNHFSSRYKYLYNNEITGKMALELLSHSIENEYFLSPLLGCKLIKRSFIINNKLNFINTLYEDDMFTFLAFLHSKKIGLVTGSHLYYYQNKSSITHFFTDKYIDDFFYTFRQLYQYINSNNKDCYYKYFDKSLKSMINCMINNITESEQQSVFKAKTFVAFYKNIKIEEYYKYSFAITI